MATTDAGGGGLYRPARRRLWRYVAGAVAVAVAAVVVAVVVAAVREARRTVPQFPSLVERPDPRLHGTVAYLARDGCIHLIAASGTGDRSVHCLPKGQDPETAKRLGKLIGPQLVWRSDGRLEITMFRMPMGPKGTWRAGSQQLLDVRTGTVEHVPASALPTEPTKGRDTAVAPDGRTVTVVSEPDAGTAEVRVTPAGGSPRSVLSVQGPRFYRLASVAWGPDAGWIAADDLRILVIVPGPTPTTRVLVTPADTGFGPEFRRYAVTADVPAA
jgi:hypothetical protein